MDKYLEILQSYWGYDSFRPLQREIIASIGSGKDTLGLMPTGGGKSITFQVPALAREGLCLVITPLIALMRDQVEHLRVRNIKAMAVYSGMTPAEISIALDNCVYGKYKFLYISPERLDSELFRCKVLSMHVSLITVDESHCISQWGYDFRPAYLNIVSIRKLLPNVPVLALTATATPVVVDDIQEKLCFREKNVLSMSFMRDNLAYKVMKTEDKDGELLRILSRIDGSAIVYVRNRRRTREIVDTLTQRGITATFYHAGLSYTQRNERQRAWHKGDKRVIVATNAFGMGIDKPDVRLVVHYDLPDSIEAYFQEAGRAGRDGKRALALILYASSDKMTLSKRVSDNFPPKERVLDIYEHLQYFFKMAMGDGMGCVRQFNLEEFCRVYNYFPLMVDSALRILSNSGYLEYTDEQENASRLRFTIERDELYRLRRLDRSTENLIQVILRSYTGLFTDFVYINEDSLALRTGLTPSWIYDTLTLLTKSGIVQYIPRKRTPYIIYTRPRTDITRMFIPPSAYEERKERYQNRIKAMQAYVSSTQTCRVRMLLGYFGESNVPDCGQCDVCLSGRSSNILTENDFERLKQEMIQHLSTPLTPAALVEKTGNKRATEVLRILLDEGILRMENGLICLP